MKYKLLYPVIALVIISVCTIVIVAEDKAEKKEPALSQWEVQLQEYRSKLKEHPDDIEIHRAYQNLGRKWGLVNNLRDEYSAKLKAEPTNPLSHYLYGRLLDGKDLENAFNKALELETKSPNITLRFWLYFGLGQFYLDNQRYKESLQNLESALKLKPDSLVARPARQPDTSRAGGGDPDSELQTRLRWDVQHQMALLYYTTNDTTKALESWDKILKTNPDYLDAYLGKGILFKSKGDYDNAIKELEIILKKDSTYWKAYEPLIQCYHGKQDYKKGEELRGKVRKIYQESSFEVEEKIIIDIISLKKGILIVKERIVPITEIEEKTNDKCVEIEYPQYRLEFHEKQIGEFPKVSYDYFSQLDPQGKTKLFRNERCRDDMIIYKKVLSYPELLKIILEKEK